LEPPCAASPSPHCSPPPHCSRLLEVSADHGHLTPTLVDLAPDGTAKAISRGFLNLRYREGLAAEKPVPPGTPVRASVRFSPQDHTVRAGHRIALVVQSSNAVWAVPDQPAGSTFTVHHGRSALVLPVAP
jgi:X-Pro dipeptidyl-peptidase